MEISLDKAKTEKLFYFVVTGTIYNTKLKKCLILERSKNEKAHPGLWGVVGGKLEWTDLKNNPITRKNFDVLDWEGLVEKVLIREAKEESNLAVSDFHYLDSVVFLRPDKIPVVCMKFAVATDEEDVKTPAEFDGFAWVNGEEVKGYQCIQGIEQEVLKTIEIFSANK